MTKIKLIMIMAMQRSGTTALFQTLSTARRLVSHEESPDSAIYFDYFLRPESEIAGVLRSSGSRVLLKPVRETERRTLVSIIDEYKDYDLNILWLYRDPVNVIFSCGEMGWGDAIPEEWVAREWIARNRMVTELPQDYHDKVTLLRYEELVSDPSVLKSLNRKLGIRTRTTLRHDSNAGRARMPIVTQAQVDALTSLTLLELDRLRTAWRETGPAAKWKLSFGTLATRLKGHVPASSARPRLGGRREVTDTSTVPNFESERFQLEPHDCLRHWRDSGNHHYAATNNSWFFSGYEEVSDALNDSARFVYQTGSSFGDSPRLFEEHLRDAIAASAIPESAELTVSRLESLASQVIARRTAEGHFDLFSVCRVAVASMFYQMLGVNSEGPNGFFERTIRGDSIDTLGDSVSPGGLLSRVVTQASLLHRELQSVLQFGSYYHYVIAILVSGAVHFLLGEPDLQEEIRRDPERLPSALTELIRLAYPLLVVERWTKVEVELAGCVIPAHNLVYLAIGAANRDPAVFERPDEFVMGRCTISTKKVLTGYADVASPCAHWEDLGHLVCRTLLKVLLTTFPIIKPVRPMGDSQFTITQSSGDLHELLQIPLIRYVRKVVVHFHSS